MAFLAQDPNQDPNNPQNGQAPGAPGQGGAATAGQSAVLGGSSAPSTDTSAPTLSSTGGGTLGGGAPSSGAASSGGAASPKGTSSGSFTNLQNYVNANVGTDAQMGQAVTGTVDNKAQQTTQVGQQFDATGETAANQATVNENPNIIKNLRDAGNGQNTLGNLSSDEFNREYNAKYTGPNTAQDVSGYGDTKQAYNDTQDYAQKAASTDVNDRGAVLADTYGKGGQQYNQGQRSLDSFLLGAGQGGSQALQNIGAKYGDFANNFNSLTDAVNGRIAADQATTAKTGQDVQRASKFAFDNTQGRLNVAAGKAGARNTADAAEYDKLTGAGSDPAALKAAGMSDDAIKLLQAQGANIGSYIGKGGTYNVGNFADAGDVSNYQQLQKLISGAGGTVDAKYGDSDFAKNNASAPTVAQDKVKAANDLVTLQDQLQGRIGTQTTADDATISNILQSYAQGNVAPAEALGISADNLNTAYHAGMHDLSPFVTTNNPTAIGQVATGAEAQQFNQLLAALGLSTPAIQAAPLSAGNFNADAFNAAVKHDQDQQAAMAASQAAQAAYAANQAPPMTPAQKAADDQAKSRGISTV